MLNIQNMTYLQGGIPLFQLANLQAFANQRIGLVGRNGCGKSTLFRLIRGETRPDNGEISLQSGKTIAFVEQEIDSSAQPALEFALDGDVQLRELEKILMPKNNVIQHDSAWFDAQQHFEAIDGYGAKARAAQLLNGLGFANDALERPVTSFSGGWRMRLNLARALMHRADLPLAIYRKAQNYAGSLWMLMAEVRATLFQRPAIEAERYRRRTEALTEFVSRQGGLFA